MEQIREWLAHGNRILVQPGWRNSGPKHWQSVWEQEFPGIERIAQRNWDHPVAGDWVHGVHTAVEAAPGRIILVAHSLGCIAQAHWAAVHRRQARRIAGALLVAPADPARAELAEAIQGFLPLPQARLPYPSIVVASDNDPVCTLERAQWLGQLWGSSLTVLPDAGHINVDAGFGHWPAGLRHLRRLIRENLGREFD